MCPSRRPELLGNGAALGAIGGWASAVALCSPLVDELDLGEDRLSWPHPTNSGEALFVVDDATERVTREVASQSCERIHATLAEMGVAAAMVARLSS